MNKIKSYYRLCAITSKDRQLNAFVNMLDVKVIESIFTKEQRKMIFEDIDSNDIVDKSESNIDYKLKETIIGGDEEENVLISELIVDLREGGDNVYKSNSDKLCEYCGGEKTKKKNKKSKNIIKNYLLPLSPLDMFSITII